MKHHWILGVCPPGSLLRRLQVEIKNSQLIKCANFDRSGDLLLGSPYDGNKAAVWDLRSGEVAVRFCFFS